MSNSTARSAAKIWRCFTKKKIWNFKYFFKMYSKNIETLIETWSPWPSRPPLRLGKKAPWRWAEWQQRNVASQRRDGQDFLSLRRWQPCLCRPAPDVVYSMRFQGHLTNPLDSDQRDLGNLVWSVYKGTSLLWTDCVVYWWGTFGLCIWRNWATCSQPPRPRPHRNDSGHW